MQRDSRLRRQSQPEEAAAEAHECDCAPEPDDAGAGDGQRFVYALGRIEPRFPRLAVEKEFAQAAAAVDTKGKTDRQAMHAILSQPRHRYLARQMCWVFSVEGMETYILVPRDPADVDLLVEAVRPGPRPTDIDVIVGVRGPMAAPELTNGLELPTVFLIQVYSFDVDAFIRAIPRPEKITAEAFTAASEELFFRIQQLADNAGSMDDHRAVNYLSLRYPAIYGLAAEAYGRDASLAAVEVVPSRLSGARRICDVLFTFVGRTTDVREKYFVRVDVTEEFPFLVSKLAPYFDR